MGCLYVVVAFMGVVGDGWCFGGQACTTRCMKGVSRFLFDVL